MYDYGTPPGYGDTFFMYVFDGAAEGLSNGASYALRAVPVLDGDFVLRAWTGLGTMIHAAIHKSSYGTMQLYDNIRRAFYSLPTMIPARSEGQSVVPEVMYAEGGFIRFDLNNVDIAVTGGGQGGADIPVGQLVFYGVRRMRNMFSDPAPSNYRYYEKPYMYPTSVTVTTAGTSLGVRGPSVQFTIPVDDYDFELRRVESTIDSQHIAIGLYNQSWRRVSNLPVVGSHFFHQSRPTPTLIQDMNSWPSPPLLYPANSVIRFDIVSLVTSHFVPATFDLNFVGVRRIPVE